MGISGVGQRFLMFIVQCIGIFYAVLIYASNGYSKVMNYIVLEYVFAILESLENAEVGLVAKMFLLMNLLVAAEIIFEVTLFVTTALSLLAIIWLWLIILFEMVTDEICSWYHRVYSRAPPIEDERLVAAIRSSNRGYGAVQFYPATICDSSLMDDPFWPDEVSICHMVEIRRHSALWQEIVIWRVSLLNGCQKRVCTFQTWWNPDWPLSRSYNAGVVRCYQSAGVIFVMCERVKPTNVFVYDTRSGKKAAYTLFPNFLRVDTVISVKCLERLLDPKGRVEGFRFRLMDARVVFVPENDDEDDNDGWCVDMTTRIFELRLRAAMIETKVKRFDYYDTRPQIKVVRTSGDVAGVRATFTGSPFSPFMLHDGESNCYRYCANEREMTELGHQYECYACDCCTKTVTERQTVWGQRRGTVYCSHRAPPTLKYLAARALFRANPDTRNRLTADQFRQLTGIGGMEAHFG